MPLTRRAAGAVRTIAAITFVGVAGVTAWQAVVGAEPDATTLALLVLGSTSLTALAHPLPFVALVGRIRSLDVLGIKVELEVERVREIVEDFPALEDGVRVGERPRADTPAEEVDEIADTLRARLRFVRDAVLADPGTLPEEVVVARLEYERVLTPKEAQLCRRVLDELREVVDDWDERERGKLLDDLWRFSTRFATEMFDRWARLSLRRASWLVADFVQPPGRRKDFLAARDRTWLQVAARVAAPPSAFETAIARFADREPVIQEARRVLVVPDHVDHLPAELDHGRLEVAHGAIAVIRLGRLVDDPESVA